MKCQCTGPRYRCSIFFGLYDVEVAESCPVGILLRWQEGPCGVVVEPEDFLGESPLGELEPHHHIEDALHPPR